MTTTYNPRIVTDGLVMYLDAANPKSYPGTGNIWYDLSGNGNNITLMNNPTHSTDGYFTFDRTLYQYGTAGDNDALDPANITAEVFTAATNESLLVHVTNIVGKGNWNSGYGHWYLGYKSGSSLSFAHGVSSWSQGASLALTAFDATQWAQLAGTNDTAAEKLWMNGEYISSQTGTLAGERTLNNYEFQVAKNSYGSNYYSGKIAVIRLYDRALSEAELKQNFAATRGRFGL